MDILSAATLHALLQSYGLYAVFIIITLESTGVPLPGETILIIAGIYAGATHAIGIVPLIATATSAAILGDNLGYWVGRTVGAKALLRHGARVGLTAGRIEAVRHIFREQGGKIVFFGRFVAFLRTFAAALAGSCGMAWPRFLVVNAAGGLCWVLLMGGGAFLFGDRIESMATSLSVVMFTVAVALMVAAAVYGRRFERRLMQTIEHSGSTQDRLGTEKGDQ